ncbi:MAG: hypothetical protein AB1942_08150 [Pseudomonadota bacterium]
MARHLGALTGAALLAAAPALAQMKIPVPEAPGVDMRLIPLPAGVDAASALPAVIQRVGAANGGIAQQAKPALVETGGVRMRVEAVSFTRAPGLAFFFLSLPEGRGVCMAGVPLDQAGAAARPMGLACLAALGVQIPTEASPPSARAAAAPQGRPATAPARTSAPAAAPAHAANWAKVEGVYFRNLGGFGAGGMAIMRFAPTVFFKDGTFYEVDDAALEDVDLAAARTAHPKRWGRWSRQGDRFTLTDEGGQPREYPLQQGNLFKAFPAAAPAALLGSYKNLSGGGNAAFGGDVMIATRNRFNFLPGGVYTTQRSTGASNSGQSTGVGSAVATRSAGEGRFSVARHTITIEGPDGRRERRFFAYGSRKTPAQLDTGLIFIGDATYTRED